MNTASLLLFFNNVAKENQNIKLKIEVLSKDKTGLLSYTTHKINLKWIRDLNARSATVKLSGGNIEKIIRPWSGQ